MGQKVVAAKYGPVRNEPQDIGDLNLWSPMSGTHARQQLEARTAHQIPIRLANLNAFYQEDRSYHRHERLHRRFDERRHVPVAFAMADQTAEIG